ncbi:uncharacterized protein LOC106178561 isoform X1 [Lingula anatina]|uniref:Uncharacterized protein LOC106178561 isoform X1 n=1 Tax=Lingula anatina TaxID=7574 RepID=A0A1S3K3X9_LINAN|nr:uncharacterized protein LOC106178561 isoform X1 [Lingula anatina]|eukprot:XP_013417232.1 uncharacterized protein LOC106178561 isoform X1 [Lingula anatina]
MPSSRPFTSFEPGMYDRSWNPVVTSSEYASHYNSGRRPASTRIPDFFPNIHGDPHLNSYDTSYGNSYSKQLTALSQREAFTGPPRFRYGRAGGPWRHIKETTGYGGNHIMFVDGVVKQKDASRNPPFGWELSYPDTMDSHYYTLRAMTAPGTRKANILNTSFNQRAKKGYKYWYEEKKPTNPPNDGHYPMGMAESALSFSRHF